MFEGVFTPSILTILGVIMYLRFGWVVGNVGLLGTLAIVTLSTSITFLTSLSIASIATNRTVRTGGAYYMISRSLGLEPGGAVGIPLFMAQALSVSLYTIGFAESFVAVAPWASERYVGLIVTLIIGFLALTSAKLAVRSQYVIMGAIALSLLSLAFGEPLEATNIEMWGVPEQKSEGFWVVFAVFFPAVTGIMAGVNMSGDLKNPGKAIPTGTFLAVGAGYIIYMLLPILLAGRADASTLVADPLIMRKISFWGDAILLGVWGATLSSAMGSMLGAPRVLQALARDRILPSPLRWLGKGTKETDNPRNGIFVTLIIALTAVYLGDLDLIAPVLSMFFLATYGALNIAAGIEKIVGSPSFRPRFKVHWIFSLAGAVGCIAVMFLINTAATVVAVIFLVGVFLWLERRQMKTTWGDVREGMWLTIIRVGLLKLKRNPNPRSWRPHFLVLSGAPTKRWHLIDIANNFIQNRGLMTVSTILPADKITAERTISMENNIRDYLLQRGINCLVRVVVGENPFVGAVRLVESYGLGTLVPNTILLGDTSDPQHKIEYAEMIRTFYNIKRNVLIISEEIDNEHKRHELIDVWWGGLKHNGALMIILAYMLQQSLPWSGARIRLNMAVASESAAQDARNNLNQLVEKLRIPIEENLIILGERTFPQVLDIVSRQADLVMLGLADPGEKFLPYYNNLKNMTAHFPTTVFVLAAQDVQFEEVLV